MAKETSGAPEGGRSRHMKRFVAPVGLDCKSIIMRQLTGDDEVCVAIWAERKLARNPLLASTPTGIYGVQTREEMRRALVAVDDKPVNADDVPFAPMDGWSSATSDWLAMCFRDLNRVDAEAAKKSVAAAELLTDAEVAKILSLAI